MRKPTCLDQLVLIYAMIVKPAATMCLGLLVVVRSVGCSDGRVRACNRHSAVRIVVLRAEIFRLNSAQHATQFVETNRIELEGRCYSRVVWSSMVI